MKKDLIILALTSLILNVSCKKINETQNPSKTTQTNRTMALELEDDAANPNNPYDEIGRIHNNGLLYVQKTNGINNHNVGDIYAAAVEYATANGLSIPTEDDFNKNVTKISAGVDQYISNLSISGTAKNHISVILNTLSDDDDSYAIRKSKVTEVETAVSASALTATEKEMVLKVASTARYSAVYWINIDTGFDPVNDTDPQPYRIRLATDQEVRAAWRAIYDAAGAIFGNVIQSIGLSAFA
ncbi:hypothetical protein [Taibaiella koreensis]|uniref:hypothetical protein n=1 Tax=Taibaiella koreensis TaxID=1268548 RepID=UPI0013C2C5FE|nr:hypothetical protein [Taibaiella koreensis]